MIIRIDGQECTCEKGEYILAVARRNDIEIPTLCHHPAVPGQGCCRVCIVEVVAGDRSKVVTSCIYPIDRECDVYTASETIASERALILALMHKRAPQSDTIAEMAQKYGAGEYARITSADQNKCILCGLCVKACLAMGSGAIATILRGTDKRVATPFDEPSIECIGCGSCAHICPTGNIELVDTDDMRTIWKRSFDLAKCERCDRILGTPETLARAAANAGIEPAALCDGCRRQETVAALDEAWPY